MIKTKNGNVTLMIFPIGIMILIVILVSIAFLYIQITVQIYEIKSNLFYIVSSSFTQADIEKLAYRDYSLSLSDLKTNLNDLLKENYLAKNGGKGIVDIHCKNIKLLRSDIEVLEHTENKYATPIICVNIKVVFTPIISLLGNKIDLSIHDDIKINLLEFAK